MKDNKQSFSNNPNNKTHRFSSIQTLFKQYIRLNRKMRGMPEKYDTCSKLINFVFQISEIFKIFVNIYNFTKIG